MNELMVLLAATLWASGGIFINLIAPAGFSGPQMTAIRLLSVPVMVGVLLLCTDRAALRVRRRDLVWFALLGAVGVFTFNLLYTASIQLTGMATAAVLIYLMPSLVMLYSVLVLGERFTARKGVCLVLSLAGCALVSGMATGFTAAPVGVAAGLGAAVCYAVYNLIVATKLQKYSPVTNVFYPFLMAAVCSVLYVAVIGELPGLAVLTVRRPDGALLCVALGLVSSVLPYWLFNTAVKRLPPSRASILATFEPVAAALFGVLLFRETLDMAKLLGIACELAALVLLALPEKTKGTERRRAHADH